MYALVPRRRDEERHHVSSQKMEGADLRRFSKPPFQTIDDFSDEAVVRVKCEDPFSVASSHGNSSREDYLQYQDFPIQPMPEQPMSGGFYQNISLVQITNLFANSQLSAKNARM